MWMAFKVTRSKVAILSSENSWSCYKVVSSSREQASEVADSDSYVFSDTKELPLLLSPAHQMQFYTSIHHNQEEVVVTCYGPEATNIHDIDESVNFESRVVTADCRYSVVY
jgi:C4-dicarboxylate-specific signal transduction histidine kinase